MDCVIPTSIGHAMQYWLALENPMQCACVDMIGVNGKLVWVHMYIAANAEIKGSG